MGHSNDDIDTEDDHDHQPSRRIHRSIPEQGLSVEIVKSERTVLELYRQFRDGWLELRAAFQREFVWTQEQQSRLVESVLARIPLPPIYLSEDADGRMLVIDGQQRLTTLFRFLDGEFALEHVDLLPHLSGKHFRDLDARLRRRLEATGLTVFLIQPSSAPDTALYLFERLNTGGTALTAQEIRGALLQGPARDMIRDIADGPFRKVAGLHVSYRQARADELTLRGLAFLAFGVEAYPGDMASFLNNALHELNHMEHHALLSIKERYLRALSLTGEVFEDSAFRRVDPRTGSVKPQINAALMDVEIWGFDRVPEPVNSWVAHKHAVRVAMLGLQSDPRFVGAISHSTSSSPRVRQRFHQWEEALKHVAHTHP